MVASASLPAAKPASAKNNASPSSCANMRRQRHIADDADEAAKVSKQQAHQQRPAGKAERDGADARNMQRHEPQQNAQRKPDAQRHQVGFMQLAHTMPGDLQKLLQAFRRADDHSAVGHREGGVAFGDERHAVAFDARDRHPEARAEVKVAQRLAEEFGRRDHHLHAVVVSVDERRGFRFLAQQHGEYFGILFVGHEHHDLAGLEAVIGADWHQAAVLQHARDLAFSAFEHGDFVDLFVVNRRIGDLDKVAADRGRSPLLTF